MSALTLNYVVPGDDFTRAGEASSDVKHKLKQIGYDSEVIRRVAIAMYEGEINMVIHAKGGEITVTVAPDHITMVLKDVGPGIPDVEKAMRPFYTSQPGEERSGMGFTVMQSFMDGLTVKSQLGRGTTVSMVKKVASAAAPAADEAADERENAAG